MKNSYKDTIWLSVLFLVVVGTRLPFLWNGYGVEEDSWGLVLNARSMAESGHYSYSRLPGHPLQEFILALMPYAGPATFNLVSAIFAGMAIVVFALIMKHYGMKQSIPASLALAFLPVFYISSVYTIDYLWALSLILLAYYLALKKKVLWAAIMLGLAVGCRLTSASMVIPLLVILWADTPSNRFRRLLIFILTFIITSFLLYLPAINVYGVAIFNTYDLPYPPLTKVLYKGSLGVLGITGMAALLFSVIIILKNIRKKRTDTEPAMAGSHQLAWILAVMLTLVIYLRLPEKSAFLLPALPFVILLIARAMKSRIALTVFYILCMLSPFMFGMNLTDPYRGASYSYAAQKFTVSGQEIFIDPLSGPVFDDYSKRKNKAAFTRAVLSEMRTLKEPSVFICGWWYNELTVRMQEEGPAKNAALLEFANEDQVRAIASKNIPVYYFEEMDAVNDRKFGKSFTAKYARKWTIPE